MSSANSKVTLETKPNVKDELDYSDPGGKDRNYSSMDASEGSCSRQTGESKGDCRQEVPRVTNPSQDTTHPTRPNRKRNLLDQVLSEKKMALLRSPEVIHWLQSQQHSRRENKQFKKRRSDPEGASATAVSSQQHYTTSLPSSSHTTPQPVSTQNNPSLLTLSQTPVTYEQQVFSVDDQGQTWESGQSSPGDIITGQSQAYHDFRSGQVRLESPGQGILQIDLSMQDDVSKQGQLRQSGQQRALPEDIQASLGYPCGIGHSGQGQSNVMLPNTVAEHGNMTGQIKEIPDFQLQYQLKGHDSLSERRTLSQGHLLPRQGHATESEHFVETTFSPAQRPYNVTSTTSVYDPTAHAQVVNSPCFSVTNIPGDMPPNLADLHQLACIATGTMAPQSVREGASSYVKTQTRAPHTSRGIVLDPPSSEPS